MTSQATTIQKSLWKTLLPVFVILLISIGALYMVKSQLGKSPSSASGQGAEIAVGSTLPDFVLTGLDKKTTQVSQLNYKVLLVNFWATWCEACLIEMPSIVGLKAKYGSKGLEVAAINLDENPDAVVPKAVKQMHMNFPIFTDPDSKLSEIFDVHAIPLTALIDRDRKILLLEPGERDWLAADIKEKMEQWLK